MARHSNATPRSATSTLHKQTSDLTNESSPNIDASLKRRTRLLITNSSIAPQTRSLIRYALEIKDPDLAQVVRRVEGGEKTIDHLYAEPL